MKRAISLLLCAVLVFSTFSFFKVQAESTATVMENSANGVSVSGTNSVGNLLSDEIYQFQEESDLEALEYNSGYAVIDLSFADNIATVEYSSMENANLIVALYSEDGTQLLASGNAVVSAEETIATVNIEGTMPQYFMASAYLVDIYDYSPLCPAYDTPMYTREMQDLLASTVEDYDQEKVLNLDESTDTNFAVYTDSVVVIEGDNGVNTVVSTDYESDTYVVENADNQITSLIPGTIIAYPWAEGEVLIVKISKISVNGTTVTITGAEMEIEEVFAYMKLETEVGMDNAEVDDSACDEGVTYKGIIEETAPSTRAWEGGAEVKRKFFFGLEKEFKNKEENVSVKLSGGLTLSTEASFSFYISLKHQYVQLKFTPKIGLDVTVSGKITAVEVPIGEVKLPTAIPGVVIEGKIDVVLDFEISVTFKGSFSQTFGFGFDSEVGFQNLSSKPTADFDIELEGKMFLGAKIKLDVAFLDEDITSVGVSWEGGVEISGKIDVLDHIGKPNEKDLEIHNCSLCEERNFDFVNKFSVEIIILKYIKWETTFREVKVHLFKTYKSYDLTNGGSGFGTCPNKAYRITMNVIDGSGNPVSGAVIQSETGEEWGTTNNYGVLIKYLPIGTYGIVITTGDFQIKRSIKISENRKILLNINSEDVADGINGKLDLYLNTSSYEDLITPGNTTVLSRYNGNTYLVMDIPMTWTEAKQYCESIGGHLLTVTDKQENEFIVDLLEVHATKNCYWIGLHRESVKMPWKWVTGENLSFQNWASNEPNNDSNRGELTVHLFGKLYTGGKGTKYIGDWNDSTATGAGYASSFYNLNNYGFICEIENDVINENAVLAEKKIKNDYGIEENYQTEEAISVESPGKRMIYGGEYGTKVEGSRVIKTSFFNNLVPGELYLLLSLANMKTDNPMAAENLLYVDLAKAREDGTLEFQYVQRVDSNISYVMACGASYKDLKDAIITFPPMAADDNTNVVKPKVVYDGVELIENKDYVIVGNADYSVEGTYTCYIRGVHSYTGTVQCQYNVEKLPGGDATLKFKGAYLKLEADLTIAFQVMPHVFANGAYENPRVEYSIPDVLNNSVRTAVVTEYTIGGDGRLNFPFKGISPRMMKAPITATLYGTYEGKEYSFTMTYALSTYAYNQLGKTSDAKFMTLLADLLNFGTAHQQYAGHELDNLINAEMTETHKAAASTYALDNLNDIQDVSYAVIENPTAKFNSGALVYLNAVVVRLIFTCADTTDASLYITCDGAEYTIPASEWVPVSGYTDRYQYDISALMAKQMGSAIHATILRNGVAISNTLQYSIETYVSRNINKTTHSEVLRELLKYTIYYGNSVAAYFSK